MTFIRKFYLKNDQLYVDEVNIKIALLLREYKYLTYFTDGFLRYIYYSTRYKNAKNLIHKALSIIFSFYFVFLFLYS